MDEVNVAKSSQFLDLDDEKKHELITVKTKST